MMDNKKLKETIAFDYRGRAASRLASEHKLPGVRDRVRSEGQFSAHSNPDARRRVVTTPKEIVQPTAWADRRAHQRRAPTEPYAKNRLVKRTLAQTGLPAHERQVRVIRYLQRQLRAAWVTARSGQVDGRGV